MNDEQANVVLIGMLDLACSVRDDGSDDIAATARRVLDAAHGDPIAALVVAAALIRTDQPVDAWWLDGLNGLRPQQNALRPCGTRAAFQRHKDHGEPIDDACRAAERAYQAARKREQRRRPAEGEAA